MAPQLLFHAHSTVSFDVHSPFSPQATQALHFTSSKITNYTRTMSYRAYPNFKCRPMVLALQDSTGIVCISVNHAVIPKVYDSLPVHNKLMV